MQKVIKRNRRDENKIKIININLTKRTLTPKNQITTNIKHPQLKHKKPPITLIILIKIKRQRNKQNNIKIKQIKIIINK